jgi:PPM family protein phosphatase
MVALRWGALTDVGRSRSLNEDAIVAAFPVFAVADGMGGHAAGEVASQLTAEHLSNLPAGGDPTGERLVAAIRSANRAIFNRSLAEPLLRGMGTTVCALTIIGDRIAIANVGDSRVYTVRGGVFTQVSQDHSYVAELVNAGEITWMQARSHPHRNIVTRALGIEPDVAVDLWEFPAIVGERFLLCSDGLVDEVLDTDIAELMLANVDPQAAAAALVQLANDNGGHDNISVVVVDVIEGESNLAPAGAELPAPLVIAPFDRPTVREDDEPMAALVDETPRASKPGKAPKSTANRIRGVVFALVLFGIIGTVIGGVQYYGGAGTHVGFSGDQVTVFKGRNGGVLWVKPSIVRKSTLTKAKLSAEAQKQVSATVSFTDEKAADAWIDALSKNPNLAPGMVPPTTTTVAPTTTTTLPPTTTTIVPTTTTVAGP